MTWCRFLTLGDTNLATFHTLNKCGNPCADGWIQRLHGISDAEDERMHRRKVLHRESVSHWSKQCVQERQRRQCSPNFHRTILYASSIKPRERWVSEWVVA